MQDLQALVRQPNVGRKMVLIPEGFREGLVYFNSRDLISDFDVDVVPNDLNNVISGHTLADVLFGLGGNDRIVGNAGNDTIFGDDGNDVLSGNAGRDLLGGGDGDDRIRGHGGNDSIVGDAGDDTLQGYGGRDEFQGGAGDDYIDGGGGVDTAHLLGDILTEDGEFNYDYIRQGNSRGIVTDLSGVEGTDTLRSIEQLKFEDFTIFLDGTNNTPIAFDDELETDEDTAAVFDILGNDVDFDRDFLGLDDDTTVQSINFTPVTGGTLVITPGGAAVEFDPGNDFQFLALGEERTETFTYIVADNDGATDEGFAEITILGVNDAPVTNDFAVSGNEDDTSIAFSLAPNSFDIDATDILTYALFGPEEIRGTVNFNPVTGEGELILGDDFQYLVDGQSEVIELDFKAIDDSGADNDTSNKSTVTITVNGANDADVETADEFEFTSENQSIFGTGEAFVFDDPLPFIGLDTEFSDRVTVIPSIDIVIAETPAVGIDFSLDAKIGLQPIFTLTSGDIDTQLTGELTFQGPNQVAPGQEVTLQSGFLLSDGSFQTFSPNITLGLDLIFELASRAAFFVGSDDFELFNFDVNEVIELFRFSGEDAMLEIPLPADSSLTVGLPVINTVSEPFIAANQTLESSGESNPILSATFDIDGLITSLLNTAGIPIPPLEDSVDFSAFGFTFSAFYNLLDLEFVGDLTIQQDFDLSLGDLSGILTLENGDVIEFTPGEDVTFIVPEGFDINGNETLDFTTELNINGDAADDSVGALLDQLTSLNFDLDFDISVLSGGVSAEFLGVGLGEFTIGPLFEDSIDVFDANRFATIFDDEFGLQGFNTATGEFEIDASLLNPSGLAQHDDFIMS